MSSLKLAYSDRSIEQTKFYYELIEKQELTDVILACNDGFQIKAHRTIISASSLFFREVIVNSNNTNPFIYLKGVNQKSLQSLLEFMYTGETVVKTENVDDLIAIGNELKILGIMEMEVKDGKTLMEDTEKIDTSEAPLNLTKGLKCEQEFDDKVINPTHLENKFDEKVSSKREAKVRELKRVGKNSLVDAPRGQNFFPLIPVDPNSKQFTCPMARSYLRSCLNILGFSRSSFKRYGEVKHEPVGWPKEVPWVTFNSPFNTKISEVKTICRALFKIHMKDINFDTYFQGKGGGWKWTTEETISTTATSILVKSDD